MDQNNKIDIALFIVGLAITYIGVFFLIDLVWVGAEYLFEGAVHTSKVDGFICGILSYHIVKDIMRLDREVSKKHG